MQRLGVLRWGMAYLGWIGLSNDERDDECTFPFHSVFLLFIFTDTFDSLAYFVDSKSDFCGGRLHATAQLATAFFEMDTRDCNVHLWTSSLFFRSILWDIPGRLRICCGGLLSWTYLIRI